jgi:integrase
MNATNNRNIDRFDAGRSASRGDWLQRDERVTALRDRLEARADSRAAAELRTTVKSARDFVRGFDSRDIAATTVTRYARTVEHMRKTGQRPEDAMCKNTFEFRRAALVHTTRSEVKLALRDLDKHRRSGDVTKAARAYSQVADGLATLRQYPPTTGSREADLKRTSAFHGPSHAEQERSNGKRISLNGLPAEWRDAVAQQTNERDRPALAALALTGCRPAEVRGIRVRQDDDYVTLTIQSAKVDKDRGIESRTIAMNRDSLSDTQAGRDLVGWLGNREQRTISYTGSVEAFCERIDRAADRAELRQVSAYTYRHAAARDLKATGVERSEIANRLGHRSNHSQSVYG